MSAFFLAGELLRAAVEQALDASIELTVPSCVVATGFRGSILGALSSAPTAGMPALPFTGPDRRRAMDAERALLPAEEGGGDIPDQAPASLEMAYRLLSNHGDGEWGSGAMMVEESGRLLSCGGEARRC